MKDQLSCFLLGLLLLADARLAPAAAEPGPRWSTERAKQWYLQQPWPVGCNYVPSTAINQLETWQADTFDPGTIERELGWAEGIGFNTVRIFLHDLAWQADPEGFKQRLDRFLGIAWSHRIRTIVTFFTNGMYGYSGEPYIGKQPAPMPGVHNSGWVQTPGAAIVNDPSRWGRLEHYVKDVMTAFARDDRILLWSLYNEPENAKKGAKSLPLLREVFAWARSVDPVQPLSAPIMRLPSPKSTTQDIVAFLLENCDVLTFHCYGNPETVNAYLELLRVHGRPLICTEYMARTRGSTFENTLPVYQRERVGAISFGLVAGKMNTHFPWGSKQGSPEPEIWFHDIFRADGSPFDPREIALIKELTSGPSAHGGQIE